MSTFEAGAEPPCDPRAAFAELSKIMLGEQQLSETLARVAELAKQTIPEAAEVSVTLVQCRDRHRGLRRRRLRPAGTAVQRRKRKHRGVTQGIVDDIQRAPLS